MHRSAPLYLLPCLIITACGSSAVDTTLPDDPKAVSAAGPEQAIATEAPADPKPAPTPAPTPASSPCAGRYAYIPRDFNSEVGFAVEVQPTAVSMQWTDYSNAFAEKRIQTDGSIVFHLDNGGPSELKCSGSQATVRFAETQYASPRSFRLSRVDKDIFAIAEENGWVPGE